MEITGMEARGSTWYSSSLDWQLHPKLDWSLETCRCTRLLSCRSSSLDLSPYSQPNQSSGHSLSCCHCCTTPDFCTSQLQQFLWCSI